MSDETETESTPQLWDQHDGQTLTPTGWLPTASVQAQRDKAESLHNSAWWSSFIGLIIFGPLAVVGIILGVLARARGSKWGISLSSGPIITGVVGTILWIAVSAVIFSTINGQMASDGDEVPPSDLGSQQLASDYVPAQVDVGPFQPPDEFGYRRTTITITNPSSNPVSCTFVVTMTIDSVDGLTLYDSDQTAVNFLKPGQSFDAEMIFSAEIPDDAMYTVAESPCIPE